MAKIVKDNTTFEGDIMYENDRVACSCGSERFKMVAHLDMTDKSITSYTCNECGKEVCVTVERDMLC